MVNLCLTLITASQQSLHHHNQQQIATETYYAQLLRDQVFTMKETYFAQGYASQSFVDEQETVKAHLRSAVESSVLGDKQGNGGLENIFETNKLSVMEEEMMKIFDDLLRLDSFPSVEDEITSEQVSKSKAAAPVPATLTQNKKSSESKSNNTKKETGAKKKQRL